MSNVQSSFFINTRGIEKWKMSMQGMETRFPRAMANAINRTLDFAKTRIYKEVTSIYSIQQKDIKKTLYKVRASKSGLYGYIRSSGRALPLGKFPHISSQFNPKAKRVKVRVKKSDGMKVVNTSPGRPNAFVQNIYEWAGNKSGIFVRKDSRRFPVISLRSLSVPQMINNPDVIKKIQSAAEKKLNERLKHEVNWTMEQELKKKAGGGK